MVHCPPICVGIIWCCVMHYIANSYLVVVYTHALASQSRTVVEMGFILASMKYALFMYTVCVHVRILLYISGASTARLAFTVLVL